MAKRQSRKIRRGPVAKRLGLKKGDKVTVKPMGAKPSIKIVGTGRNARVQASRTVKVTVSRPIGRKFGRTRRATFS